MSREMRRVPANWNHPKDEKGEFIPLRTGFANVAADWDKSNAKWAKGLFFNGESWSSLPVCEEKELTYSKVCGERPSPDAYMPEWTPEEATHFMMYEACTDGTPISPAFATAEELAQWLTNTKARFYRYEPADYDTWLKVARNENAINAYLAFIRKWHNG